MTSHSSKLKPTKPSKLYNLIRERWPEYIVEVIVIILSISISFAVDEWKDERQKRENAQRYLHELHNDIETDVRQLSEIITESRQVVKQATALSELNSQAIKPSANQLIQQIRFVFKRPRFVAEDVTFTDLKSTGNMQLINNFQLKRALFDYYKHYEVTVQVENAELETTNSIVGPYLLRRIPLVNRPTTGKAVDYIALVNEPEFQNTLFVRITTRTELLSNYQEISQKGKRILALIKSQYTD